MSQHVQPHKDSPAIDQTRGEGIAKQKGFKNAGKGPDAMFLRKRKSVRQEHQPMYQRFTPREAP